MVAGSPATFDETGYKAQTHVEIKGIVDVGEVGDTQNDITIDTLIGRVEHVNGSLIWAKLLSATALSVMTRARF